MVLNIFCVSMMIYSSLFRLTLRNISLTLFKQVAHDKIHKQNEDVVRTFKSVVIFIKFKHLNAKLPR